MKNVFPVLCVAISLAPFAIAQDKAAPEGKGVVRLVTEQTPEKVVQLMQDEGYRAKQMTRENGGTYIQSSANGAVFEVNFHACNDQNVNCELLVFSTGLDFASPIDPELVLAWNREQYTQAFLDNEGDPYVTLNVNIRHGITEENFKDTLSWYVSEMGGFLPHVGWSLDDVDSEEVLADEVVPT